MSVFLEAFSLTPSALFPPPCSEKKTEIFAEIWQRIMFRMLTNESLLQRRRCHRKVTDEESDFYALHPLTILFVKPSLLIRLAYGKPPSPLGKAFIRAFIS